jgi:iron complex outermembrane receptor protein
MVTVLSRQEIQAAPVQSVNDLLKQFVGVDVRQRGAIGAQTDVSIRGSNYEQIAILLNGINIGDPQTGHNVFSLPIDISDIERIEVLEGPAGRIYGTSSLLGAINIVTKGASSTAPPQRDSGKRVGRDWRAGKVPNTATVPAFTRLIVRASHPLNIFLQHSFHLSLSVITD